MTKAIFFAILRCHLGDGRVLDLVAKVAPARFQRLGLGFVGQQARRHLGVGMNVDGDERIKVDFRHAVFLSV